MYDLKIENARLYPMHGDAHLAGARSLAVSDGCIAALDAQGDAKEVVDAGNLALLPGFIDCHTHALYSGHRMREHLMKLRGASYAEIARDGGGILSTVEAVRAATQAELVEATLPRLAALASEGVTTVEIKSGYGLSLDDELKMLRAIAALDARTPLEIYPTFLGAHAVPRGTSKADYVAEIVDRMLPAVSEQGLARAVDIFVEGIAFDLDDLRAIFTRARALGFELRAHSEQLSNLGGTRLAAELGARSCDHLEFADAAAIEAMADAGTVAVLLPAAFYFLRESQKPPVAELRARGVAMAIASDLNPGTAPVASLLTAMHMASILFGLEPEEVLLGVTLHAARALGQENSIGSLAPGKRANFALWDLPAPEFLLYQLGGLKPDAVYIEGRRI
ncbi:MAG: imidazolonepropionase [Gammaproteobacteria bacterium]